MKSRTVFGIGAFICIGLFIMSICSVSVLADQAEPTSSGTDIPNLKGTWKVEAHGEVIQKNGEPGEWTHFSSPNETIIAEAVIAEQNQRVLRGFFKAPLGKEEQFIAMIGPDNKSWHFADYDGSSIGVIVNDSFINVIYTQINENETVMAESTWIRQE